MKTKALIFDIGNVLIYYDHGRMLRQVSEVLGIDESQAIALYVEQGLGILYERGEISSEEFYRQFSKLARLEHNSALFWEAFSDIFSPNIEMETLVQELQEKDLRLLLLSNTCETHFRFFSQTYQFFDTFDHPILSYEVGARKPEPAIFEAALKAAGYPPELCFYTDDIVEYVSAARELNIPAESFTTAAALRHDLQKLDIL